MKTVVLTSDVTIWAIRAFLRQWDEYACIPVVFLGYTHPSKLDPDFSLYLGHEFLSIGEFKDYPVKRWSDGVIQGLRQIPDDLVLLVMDDYWLTRPVNWDAVFLAEKYMIAHPDVVRFDLTTDRLYDQHHEVESIGCVDIIEAEKTATYNLSFQASIYRRELLLELLRDGETPWESEIYGSGRLNRTPYRVLGTCQWPMRYIVAINKGVLDLSAAWMYPKRSLAQADRMDLVTGGYIPREKLA